VFWRLDGNQLQGITNALIESPNHLAMQKLPLDQVGPGARVPNSSCSGIDAGAPYTFGRHSCGSQAGAAASCLGVYCVGLRPHAVTCRHPRPPICAQVLALKAQAKLALQKDKGLLVGPQYQLIVFMGRMTHQKGCDIIAEVGGGRAGREGGALGLAGSQLAAVHLALGPPAPPASSALPSCHIVPCLTELRCRGRPGCPRRLKQHPTSPPAGGQALPDHQRAGTAHL
jgi:hypothetical protein